ncbi:MAG: hypothetical protein IT349_15345 [Candidatus Eisenbacteria bacterium]|nr:hypothetical protein [Candidatus Eisenbacteria bacterium]MCC7143472.1 hypothetical protein [Candidatus Eisenbacteria bacterium]
MYREFLADSPHLIFPLAGLVIFLTIFLLVLGYVFIGLKSKRDIDPLAALPFEDGESGRAAKRGV